VAIRVIGQGTPAIETALTQSSVQWSITATLLYAYVYQAMPGQQLVLKHVWMCKKKRSLHVSDWRPLSTLIQMPLFLVLLWLLTIYINAEAGGKLGLRSIRSSIQLCMLSATRSMEWTRPCSYSVPFINTADVSPLGSLPYG
jgi:hypothetical protein